jgi:hypothetical protein
MVLRVSLLIAALGVVLGIPLALLTGHSMGSMLFGLEPYERWTALASLVGVGCERSGRWLSAGAARGVDRSHAGAS